MHGNIVQRESIAASHLYRSSVLENSALKDMSRSSNYLRSTGAAPADGAAVYEDPNLFLPGSKIDIHILTNVALGSLIVCVS